MSYSLRMTVILAAGLGLGAGCTGGLDQMPPAGNPDAGVVEEPDAAPVAGLARQIFDQDVAPVLASACASCHEGTVGSSPYKFMGEITPTDDYLAVTTDLAIVGGFNPALASILTKGDHDGRAFTDPEKALFSAWMAQEVLDRGIDLSNPPVPEPAAALTARQALAQWSACMQYSTWIDSQVFTWADKGSNNGPCRQCHNDGAGAFNANADESIMFDMNKKEIFIRSFFAVAPKDLANPAAGYHVVINTAKLCAKGQGDGQSHPNYNCNGGNQMGYLQDFYDRTYASLATCTAVPAFPVE